MGSARLICKHATVRRTANLVGFRHAHRLRIHDERRGPAAGRGIPATDAVVYPQGLVRVRIEDDTAVIAGDESPAPIATFRVFVLSNSTAGVVRTVVPHYD